MIFLVGAVETCFRFVETCFARFNFVEAYGFQAAFGGLGLGVYKDELFVLAAGAAAFP